jgi:hypothetical protein
MKTDKIKDNTPIKEAFALVIEDLKSLEIQIRGLSDKVAEMEKQEGLKEVKDNVDKILKILAKR